MLKKFSSTGLLCLVISVVLSAGLSPDALAQEPIYVDSVPFNRFRVSNSTLGHYLTPHFEGGLALGYTSQPFVAPAHIVPLVDGYAPRADQGLTPVHVWKVNQGSRTYYYYSIYFSPHGSGYTYLGVNGYAMAKFDPRGTPFHYWYSQSFGYYYTVNGEFPPCCSFAYHDFSWTLPTGGTFIFDPIPVPQGCNPQAEASCVARQREWDEENCSCIEQEPCVPFCEVQ